MRVLFYMPGAGWSATERVIMTAARGLAAFIAAFWTARVAIDFLWYDHRDWPRGNSLVAGHALVTTLFLALAGVYWYAAWS